MKLHLEATPAELHAKGEALIKSLADRVQFVDADLADRLRKALPPEEPALKYPALREIKDRMRGEYDRQMTAMLKRIGAVLSQSVAGAGKRAQGEPLEKAGPYIGPKGGKWADPAHKIPWKEGTERKKTPAKARKVLFHSAPHHAMETIAEEGLKPRAGGGLFAHGVYGAHSQGKVFLSAHHDAAREWHGKVGDMLVSQHDDPDKHVAVQLRIRHRPTKVDEVGNQDIEGSRYTTKPIPPEHIEFWHPKNKRWEPVSNWGKGTEAHHGHDDEDAFMAPEEHAHETSYAKVAAEKKARAQAQEAERQKRTEAEQAKQKEALAAEQAKWTGEKRDAKVKELLAQKLKSPIPGMEANKLMTQAEGTGFTWAQILNVSHQGKDLQKAIDDYRDSLEKAGPFIGPRGGKWADAKHTIPWQEGGAKEAPKQDEPKSVEFKLDVHPKIGKGGERKIYAAHDGKDEVRVSVGGPLDKDGGIKMPAASLKHFINDLSGKVDAPKTDNAAVNSVIEGKAEVLGKGDDGIAFKAGDKVVKVSTTVPYVPENRGHRTPEQAIEMLREQSEVGNKLADKGIDGVQRSEFVVSGDKGFQIKPYVEIPKKFSREQLDQIQDTVIAIHKAGYSLNDTVQAGLQDGKPVLFDVGKAKTMDADTKREGVYSPVTADMEALANLYSESGETFVRRDQSFGQKALQKVDAEFEKLLPINGGKLVHRQVVNAVTKRAEELKATLKGKALDEALDDLDSAVWHMRVTLEDEGLEVPTFGPAESTEKSLEKGAQHKYIRRIPTGKARPKYRYIYRESAAAHADRAPVAGEKIRLTEGGREGHYEVTAVHPGDWVTLKHDESGHEVSVKREWLNQLFLKEYADKHAADRKRLTKTYEAAKKHGTEKQIERARKLLADHMERFPEPAARAAELRAAHADSQAEDKGDAHSHLTAATAHLEGLKQGARGGKDSLAKAKGHIDAVTVKRARQRTSGKPKKLGDFGNKQWAYNAITGHLETSADFSAADAAYRDWKGEGDRGGPKPPAWEGGELDAVNGYLETKVSSPREAWDKLTVGVKRWDDPRVVEAMDVMREIPGYEDIRLPDEIVDWLSEQAATDYERAAQEEYEEGFSEDAFDFNFGFNAPDEETLKAMPPPDPEDLAEFEDHSAAIVEKDAKAYKRVKVHLQRQGYKASDFNEGGPLYGMSTNELIDLARRKKKD